MPLDDGERRHDLRFLLQDERARERLLGLLLRDEELVLDEPARPVGLVPARQVVEEERVRDERLAIPRPARETAGEELRGVHETHLRSAGRELQPEEEERDRERDPSRCRRPARRRRGPSAPRARPRARSRRGRRSARDRGPEEAVHPADDVLPGVLGAVEPGERRRQVPRRERLDVEIPGPDPLEAERDLDDRVRGARVPDDLADLRGPGAHLLEPAVRPEHDDALEVIADRPALPAVLPVDVHGDRAAEGDVHRARDDGRPEPLRDRRLPQVAERETRARPHDARLLVQAPDRVQASELDDGPVRVEGRVSVRSARAPEDGRLTARAAVREDGGELLDGRRAVNGRDAEVVEAEALDALGNGSRGSRHGGPILLKTKRGTWWSARPRRPHRRGT